MDDKLSPDCTTYCLGGAGLTTVAASLTLTFETGLEGSPSLARAVPLNRAAIPTTATNVSITFDISLLSLSTVGDCNISLNSPTSRENVTQGETLHVC